MSGSSDDQAFKIKAVKQVLDRRVFAAGHTIFVEGDKGGVAYILLRGDAQIYAGYGTSQQRKLTDISTGQMFGELALMANEKRTATAYTAQGCELLVISDKALRTKMEDADPFLKYWIEYLSKRVIDLTTEKDFG